MPYQAQPNGPLLFPKKEPSPAVMWLIDTGSWALPVVAAILSGASGVEALSHQDGLAAWLGIGGAIASAGVVFVTGWASKIRDSRMEVANAMGVLALETADFNARLAPPTF